ncbi:branched-chain amino acid ABC transporter permease [Martelella soudanensis]|uniref:branched-chain amino acid ABC transporter permease n=1 Tax=unclassified Martelella TaxID=2629616 RepID=UPI0015DE3367|nr:MULTISPECIES: branched-chain amino acid ABC transporter permease [unclassified Martelella]
MTMPSKLLAWGLGAVLVLGIPFVFSNPYWLSIVILVLLYAYLAYAWNLIGGIGGQLSLGHAAWFGIGAYTSTVLFIDFGLTPWIGMLAGAVIAGAIAAVIGLPCFRLRGAYFALATIAATMVLRIIVENTHGLLGGPRGLEVTLMRDAPLLFQHTRKEFYYAVAVVMVAAAFLINRAVLHSRFGAYLTAIRNDQEAALALGVNVGRYKLMAYVLSAAMTAIGGTFYAQFVLFISPEKVFGVALSVQIAVVCIIGGRGTLWGPMLGATLLLLGEEAARRFTGGIVGADMLLYGLILMLVIAFEPRGLVAILGRIAASLSRSNAKPSMEKNDGAA